MNMARRISEREYESRWDAESLAKAEEIKSDPARYQKAQNAAVKMAEEKRKELSGINRVAKRGKTRENTQQSPQRVAKRAKINPKSTKRAVTGNGAGFNVFEKI